jgi:2-polyprenyl-6-methoxyphenol hydroxylase-like FAD-dependent oxidoreductase
VAVPSTTGFTAPLGGVAMGRLLFRRSATRVRIRAAEIDDLCQIGVSDPRAVRASADRGDIIIESRLTFAAIWGRVEYWVGVVLSSSLPWSIEVMTRQAATYRVGRVLLAGDAAHVHARDGGQGLNTGVQDAVNLGWKLAQVVKKTSPQSLLDTYHAERHPVGARVLRITMALVALRRPDERTNALRDTIAELLGMDEPRKRLAAEMSGLGIHYDLGAGHPLLGRRMPDLDLVTADGRLQVFTLLHDARPVLLSLGEPGGFDIGSWEIAFSSSTPNSAVRGSFR